VAVVGNIVVVVGGVLSSVVAVVGWVIPFVVVVCASAAVVGSVVVVAGRRVSSPVVVNALVLVAYPEVLSCSVVGDVGANVEVPSRAVGVKIAQILLQHYIQRI